MQALANFSKFPLISPDEYCMIEYFRSVVGHEEKRCEDCYYIRLNKTAEIARENGFADFTTTLLISPYQNQELIEEVGKHAARKNGVAFFFQDFRDGFKESQQTAKDLNLYKQKYCGCIYSEWERYAKVKIGNEV